jgi:iron complex outermembrane receptor protein
MDDRGDHLITKIDRVGRRVRSAALAAGIAASVVAAVAHAQAPETDPTLTVRVFTAEDIQRSGARSLPEALRLANPELTQAHADQWAISARSLDAPAGNLLAPADNRLHYRPRVAGAFWNAQQSLLKDIERIEVITSAVPGWGATDINGVVRITTKSASDTQGLQIEGLDGTALRESGGVRYGGELSPSIGYRVYAKYFGREDAVLPEAAEVADSWRMAQSGFRADGQLSDRDAFSMQGDVYEGRTLWSRTGEVDVSGANVSLLWSRDVRESSNLELHVYYDRTRGNTPGEIAEEFETYDVNLQHRLATSERSQLAWGVGFHDSGVAELGSATNATGFIQNDFSLAHDRVHVSLATKLEHGELGALGVRPSGRLSWQPSGLQTLWAAVTRSVKQALPRRPKLLDPSGAETVAQELTAYEVGYRVQPQPALSVSMASFYSDYGRTTNFEQGTSGEPLENAYGAALTADFQATSRWKLSASQTAMQYPVAAAPKRLLLLRSSLELPSRTQVDATYRRASSIDGASEAGYDELELRLAWRPRSALELSFSGRNLLNDQRTEPAATAGRTAQATLAWTF